MTDTMDQIRSANTVYVPLSPGHPRVYRTSITAWAEQPIPPNDPSPVPDAIQADRRNKARLHRHIYGDLLERLRELHREIAFLRPIPEAYRVREQVARLIDDFSL